MENNSKVIEIKGIVRNQTKIGVQDGQCDDLVNLRFKDGSCRVADDGKSVYNMTSGYSQLYVHTNVFHHLLGVKDTKLYWFANIESDGETFSNLDTPIAICDVQGDVTIVQNGHLLTITCSTEQQGQNKIYYAIFKSGTNEYKVLNVNANGESSSRELYPFGRVHINMDCGFSEDKNFVHEDTSAGKIVLDDEDINYNDSGVLVPKDNDISYAARQVWHASMLKVFNDAKDANVFTQPVLALLAVKLYDGSYMYASNPVMLFPREKYSTYKNIYQDGSDKTASNKFFQTNGCRVDTSKQVTIDMAGIIPNTKFYDIKKSAFQYSSLGISEASYIPIYTSGAFAYARRTTQTGVMDLVGEQFKGHSMLRSDLRGYDILLTLGDLTNIINNVDVFQGLCLFVTKEADVYNLSADGYKNARIKAESEKEELKDGQSPGIHSYTLTGNVVYRPEIRDDEEIIHDLTNSPFYFLREYSINELKSMMNTTTKVDLSGIKYKGVLKNIEQQDTLPAEAFGRNEFIPKVVYQYNQRLHIANYQAKQYHGFPIDCFQLSNHNLQISNGDYAIDGALAGVKEGSNFQYTRSKALFISNVEDAQGYVDKAKEYKTCFAYATTKIDTQQGEQTVVRYIEPYRSDLFANGDFPNFVESLNTLITFPDARAKQMTIGIVVASQSGGVMVKSQTFNLTPHPYINLAYYIDAGLKPIDVSKFTTQGESLSNFLSGSVSKFQYRSEVNNIEDYPNGLKVSLVNNPFTFPYETTYQVGSSEIVALMSNAVAVGTGQTGAAPLYVFCKDGIYALMVDSTGEMTYTNARIIARDVCNNAKSVTPIDNGVVFTTDRGLMSIAGNEVVEIGSAAEGDVFGINDTSDYAKKIMFNAFTMQQLAELPQSLVDNTDFLTYLKGAIVNYNHNERELMVSNPEKDYTYVMDRNGNWGRRAFTAQEYVNNYPTSYRIDKAGNFYKVDADDNDTNKVYLLSNVIKLGTVAFKQAYRLVVRGYFETEDVLGLYVFGSYDGRQWSTIGGNEKEGKFTDIGCKIAHTDIKFIRLCISGKISHASRIDFVEISYDGSNLNTKLR
jgi:hypothetical protein